MVVTEDAAMPTMPRLREVPSAFGPEACLSYMFLALAIACASRPLVPPASPTEEASSPDSPSPSSPWCVAEPLRSAEAEHGVSGPLADLNMQFLQAHARARARQCRDLEANRLVLRYSFGLLEARFRGEEVTHAYILPKPYHPVKDVSHAVYLSALLFTEPRGVDRDQHILRTLFALDSALAQLQEPTSATAALLPKVLHDRETRLLQQTRNALTHFSAGELGSNEQKAYFESIRADLRANLHDMAIASLRELDGAIESTRAKVAKLDPKAWDSALVVVGVMHQARAREIGIQYFERLLGEHAGEGARNERRLVVAEHVTIPSEQLGLLAAHLVDEEGAAAIFADPLRLQWDALGDVDPAALNQFFER